MRYIALSPEAPTPEHAAYDCTLWAPSDEMVPRPLREFAAYVRTTTRRDRLYAKCGCEAHFGGPDSYIVLCHAHWDDPERPIADILAEQGDDVAIGYMQGAG